MFSSIFKITQVLPLVKTPWFNQKNSRSYRPILNLNTFGNILERLYLVQLQPHLAITLSTPVDIPPVQLNGLCASEYHQWHLRGCRGWTGTVLVALDLSAAFDTIEHPILLSRLEQTFDPFSSALQWVRSYVSPRLSFVKIGKALSKEIKCTVEVPLGPSMGPMLFCIFLIPLVNVRAFTSMDTTYNYSLL